MDERIASLDERMDRESNHHASNGCTHAPLGPTERVADIAEFLASDHHVAEFDRGNENPAVIGTNPPGISADEVFVVSVGRGWVFDQPQVAEHSQAAVETDGYAMLVESLGLAGFINQVQDSGVHAVFAKRTHNRVATHRHSGVKDSGQFHECWVSEVTAHLGDV